jgi:two-component system NtrC family sensor kinase
MSLPEHVLAATALAQEPFDREWALDELVGADERADLAARLTALVGTPVAIVAGSAAPGDDTRHAAALKVDIEPLGWLLGPRAAAAALDAAAALLQQILIARQRYKMASALHVESVRADYLALLDKHHALEASEARYRELAGALEARVAEQVRLIETRQRQLYQAERLASIGQLAAGMAHEINNPIGFVRSNLNSARGYVNQLAAALEAAEQGDAQAWQKIDAAFVLEDFAALLKDCIDGVDRVAAIVRDLKGFSNVDRDESGEIDFHASLGELCRLLNARLPKGARLEVSGEAVRRLPCRPGHLHQALFNVLDNAIKAITPGGRISVRCSVAGGCQHVEIVDDGCGIAAEALPRVFDPFFTTRPVGQGIGLGLTLARDVIVAQGGRIRLDSRPGAGTRIEIDIPLEPAR